MRFILGLVVALIAFTAPAFAQGAELRAEARLITERAQAMPGETVYLGLELVMDPGWHVYWLNAGDAGLPPEIIFEEQPAAEIGEFLWPIPHLLPVVEGEIMDYGYDDRIVLPFPVIVPEDAASEIHFDGIADYLICKDICIPESQPISLTLLVGDEQIPDLLGGEAITEAIGQTPSPFAGEIVIDRSAEPWRMSLAPEAGDFEGDVRFFPHQHEIVHSADQPLSTGERGLTLALTPSGDGEPDASLEGVIVVEASDGTRAGYEVSAEPGMVLPGTFGSAPSSAGINILAIMGLALLGGLILNLMPCVLPVLSIKAIGMVNAATKGDDSHLRAHGLWYTAGVVLSFAATAAVFVALRGAGEFVSLGFQLQYAPVVAALALIMFVIGLWLLGVFELGTSVQGVGSGLASKQGSTGAFFTGVLAAVVGAPCVGPFLGVALGSVLTQPAPAVFIVFMLMGLGLALPFLALSFAPGLHRFLPRPGAWMERLKQFFAFPMFLTAVWLLTVLGDQAGQGAVTATILGATLVGFGVWALSTAGGRLRVAGMALGALALVAGLYYPIQAALGGSPGTGGAAYADSVEFPTEPWSPERVDALLADGKGIFVDFTATWCVTCQANKRTTLERTEVRQAMADNNIVFLVADFTNKDDVIAAELKKHSRPGVPMYLLYGPGETEPKLLPQILSPSLMINEIEALTS